VAAIAAAVIKTRDVKDEGGGHMPLLSSFTSVRVNGRRIAGILVVWYDNYGR